MIWVSRKKQMSKIALSVLLVVLVLGLTACAAGPNELAHEPNPEGEVAGLWLGLWHGVIAPVTFVVSLFVEDVHFYEVHNNGNWYNFGFLLGIGLILGGGAGGGAGAGRGRR